uniref:Uncharacterized protein n=1 Tax=Sinocyclocheilus grahami TaxID=75366 RepID=A0A672RGK0_SINGR
MSIQAFSFPVPETRFFQAGQQVFKFKIRRGDMKCCACGTCKPGWSSPLHHPAFQHFSLYASLNLTLPKNEIVVPNLRHFEECQDPNSSGYL